MKLGPSTRLGPSTGFHMFQNRFAGLSDDTSSSEQPQVSGGTSLSRDNQQYNSNKYDNYSSNSNNNNNRGGNIQRQNSRENSRHRNDMNGPSRSFQANTLSRQSSASAGGGRDDHRTTSNVHSQSQIIGRRPSQQAAAAAPTSDRFEFNPNVEPTSEELHKLSSLVRTVVEEYLASSSLADFETEFKQINRQHRWVFLREMHTIALDHKEKWQKAVSKMCFHCLNSNDASLFTVDEYKHVIRKYCEAIVENDYPCDIPKIFDYTAILLGETLQANFVTLKDLYKYSGDVIDAFYGGKMLVALLNHLQENYGPHRVRELWAASGLHIKQFLGEDGSDDQKVANFIAEHVSFCIHAHKIDLN